MSMYKVIRPNDYFKFGNYVEDIGDGLIQQCTMHNENGRWIPMYNFGLALPSATVLGYLLRIQKSNLDRRGIKGER